MTNPENLYYLSGFTGSDGALLVFGEGVALLTDFRYLEQAKEESPDCLLVDVHSSYVDALAKFLRENKISGLGLDGDHLRYKEYCSFMDKLADISITEAGGLVEDLRLIKDHGEIKKIKTAATIADRAFDEVLPIIKPGVTEREISLELEFSMKKLGAEDVAFQIIVASGVRGALPHGVASGKALETGDLITMDFGAVFQGYHSDITRTVVLGESTIKQAEIYRIVLEAQLKAVGTVRSGIKASEVDRAARDIISGYGYGDCFGHGTGHGVGLNVHENPRLSKAGDTILKRGMTVTVEPGIYLPDWGGVRIEDTVVVDDNGCTVLTGCPKMKLINTLK
ncbi:MAG: aminopeptidase P family protein [Peptococcaceae bacterium]|nr:aminopeptidase P family protein [Peptococcaceae bacterium]